MKPPAGDYLFIHYGYGEQYTPQLSLLAQGAQTFTHFSPRGTSCTLRFDTAARFCGGWHDLASGNSHPCPDAATLPQQYDQCRHCQQKTGFNPAFYHATSISPQQQARNAQPHFLYLAHFAPSVVKVGITWEGRGIRRLLDQGARSALILKTYPTADLARQYEAKIAALPGIAETLQARHKHQHLKRPYDAQAGATELLATRERLAHAIGLTPDDNLPLHLDHHYLADNQLDPPNIVDITSSQTISGSCIGMIGSVLIMEQDGLQYSLPLTKLTGYMTTLSYDVQENAAAPHQVSLF